MCCRVVIYVLLTIRRARSPFSYFAQNTGTGSGRGVLPRASCMRKETGCWFLVGGRKMLPLPCGAVVSSNVKKQLDTVNIVCATKYVERVCCSVYYLALVHLPGAVCVGARAHPSLGSNWRTQPHDSRTYRCALDPSLSLFVSLRTNVRWGV